MLKIVIRAMQEKTNHY